MRLIIIPWRLWTLPHKLFSFIIQYHHYPVVSFSASSSLNTCTAKQLNLPAIDSSPVIIPFPSHFVLNRIDSSESGQGRLPAVVVRLWGKSNRVTSDQTFPGSNLACLTKVSRGFTQSFLANAGALKYTTATSFLISPKSCSFIGTAAGRYMVSALVTAS